MKYINYNAVILVAIVLFILIVAANPSYYRMISNLYGNLNKIPRLIFMIATVLSLLGLTHVIDFSNFLKHNKVEVNKKTMKIHMPNEDGKRLVSDTTKKYVAAKQHWECGLCHKMLDETFEVDHVIPLYKGGSNDISNLMALDPICHRKKTNADRLNLVSDIFIAKEKTPEINQTNRNDGEKTNTSL